MENDTPQPRLIGLAGGGRIGKATIAELLSFRFGMVEQAIADAIRDQLYEDNPCMPGGRSLRDLVDELGWAGLANHPRWRAEVVRAHQRVGDRGRRAGGESYWIDQIADTITGYLEEGERVVISDVRLPVEARWVREHGGVVWEVHRRSHRPLNGHATEAPLPPDLVDTHVWADFSIPATQAEVHRIDRTVRDALELCATILDARASKPTDRPEPSSTPECGRTPAHA